VASQFHAVLIVPLALKCLSVPELDKDRAFGWSEESALVQGIAAGYVLFGLFFF
jgi:hypothetical protein